MEKELCKTIDECHKKPKIKEVLICTNGIVMVLDENGNQVPEYQGFILEKGSKLLEVCNPKTRWYFVSWGNWKEEVSFNWHFEESENKKRINQLRTPESSNLY